MSSHGGPQCLVAGPANLSTGTALVRLRVRALKAWAWRFE